jgi:hypothetical protein
VATSTMDAEYTASAEATKEAVWIRNFINDLRIPGVHIDSVPLYINNSALKLTRNPEFHSRLLIGKKYINNSGYGWGSGAPLYALRA